MHSANLEFYSLVIFLKNEGEVIQFLNQNWTFADNRLAMKDIKRRSSGGWKMICQNLGFTLKQNTKEEKIESKINFFLVNVMFSCSFKTIYLSDYRT
jgi:hypothetical protein